MIRYVAGFMFQPFGKDLAVALIQKRHPEWQAGFLNAIGGKVEPGERSLDAMVREFREETGLVTTPEAWTHYMCYRHISKSAVVDFYHARCSDYVLRSMTDEPVAWYNIQFLHTGFYKFIPNLSWLIPMALDVNDVRGTAGQNLN